MDQVLMRGTLGPRMGSTISYKEQGKPKPNFAVRRVVKPPSSSRVSGPANRIPSSIALKKNLGAR